MEWAKILGIITASFVSEDLTCISTGLLIRSGQLDLLTGLLGCLMGIFVGDLGLFFLGRILAYGILTLPIFKSLANRFHTKHKARLLLIEERFAREGWKLIVLARFVPGLRLPVYLGAGFLGTQARNMIIFALLAGLLWTPSLVLLSAWIGPGLQSSMEKLVGNTWLALLLAILFLYLILRLFVSLCTGEGRRKIQIFFRKILSIEFWPPLLFYLPLLPGWLYWSIRYRGLYTISAANPSIENGGLLGESKAAIFKLMPQEWISDWLFIPSLESVSQQKPKLDPLEWRFKLIQKKVQQHNKKEQRTKTTKSNLKKKWQYPIVLKPDQGQRGRGVKIVYNAKQAKDYLTQVSQAVIAQVYHPGPFEAGIFYYRKPDQKKGQIFSITDKFFPRIKGDGSSSLEKLIWAHPRYAMQAKVFLRRIAQNKGDPNRILKKGELFALGQVGNHVQGTLFCDGAHLYSTALAKKIDDIAKKTRGFYFGRFDVRYEKKAELRKGIGFKIIELNGASSESTNIYDPRFSVLQVYQTLYRQWQILLEIAYQNRKYKAACTSPLKLLHMIWQYRKTQKAPKLSD